MTPFTGFPAEGVQFLHDLRENNHKDWFQAHKQTYIDAVQQPAVALVEALGEQLSAEFPPISYDTRLNGSGSLMRIYRDTRFSADKSPYKTNVAMMFVPAGCKSMETSGFGLQISPTEGAELVAGMFGFSKAQLAAYREAVDDPQTGAALVEAVERVRAAGDYTFGGKALKQGPRDYETDHPRIEWLKYKGLHVFSLPVPLDVVHTPDFVEVVMDHFRKMAPVHTWLREAVVAR